MHVNKCTFTQKSSAAIKIVLKGVSITMTQISTFEISIFGRNIHFFQKISTFDKIGSQVRHKLGAKHVQKFTFGRNVRKEKALDALNINHRTHQSRHAKQQTDTRVAGLFPGTSRVENDHK